MYRILIVMPGNQRSEVTFDSVIPALKYFDEQTHGGADFVYLFGPNGCLNCWVL